MLDSHKKNRVILAAVILLVILSVVGMVYIFSIMLNDTDDDKSISNVDIDNEYSSVPHINLEINGIDKINEIILDDYNQVMSANSGNQVNYKYYQDEQILSVLIENTVYYDLDGKFYHDFKAYNFDLINNKILSDEELLNKYGYTEEDLHQIIYNKFQQFYEKDIEQGYFNREERSFESYLMFVRVVDNLYDDIALYVKDGKLVAYKGFALNSVYEDYKIFDENAFEFNF